MKTKNTILFKDCYDQIFIVKSKTKKSNDFAKTYTCLSQNQIDFHSLMLISDDITPYLNSCFTILRKYKGKYLIYKSFGLQNSTFENILKKLYLNGVLKDKY